MRGLLLCGLLLLAAAAPDASAQGLSLGASSESPLESLRVEPEPVLNTALMSFEAAASSRLNEAIARHDPNENQVARLQELRAGLVDEMRSEAQVELQALQGDGLLTGSEVSDALGDLRDTKLDDFDIAIRAVVSGHEPPPRAFDYDKRSDYAQALTRYTLLERNGLRAWLLFLGAILGGVLAAYLVNRGLSAAADRVEPDGGSWRSGVLRAARGPCYLLAVAIAVYLGLRWLWVPGIAESSLSLMLNAATVVALAWFFWNATDAIGLLITWTFKKTYSHEVDQHAASIMSRALRIVILLGLLMFIIKVVLDTSLAGVAAGLGILGVALALVLRGTVENVGASFTIFADEPFRVGDLMSYNDEWGHVENIGFRSTRFRTLDGELVTIPNLELIDNAIYNVGARPWVRRRFHLSLPYRTPPEKAREALEILHEILDGRDGQPEDRPPRIYFETFGDYELRLLILYYFQPPDIWKALEFDTEVNLEILERFNEAGIEFAFPTSVSMLETAEDRPPLLRVGRTELNSTEDAQPTDSTDE